MFDAVQLANAFKDAGLSPDAAARIANILGNSQQELRRGSRERVDLTPASLRLVDPDTRKHELTELDFLQREGEYRRPVIQESEDRPLPQQSPAVVSLVSPQSSAASFRVGSGLFTDARGAGDQVHVDLRVGGSGRMPVLDAQANMLVGKTFRVEAGGNGKNLLRFFLEETGQEIIWRLQMENLEYTQVVTDVKWEPGVGLRVTKKNAVMWSDPGSSEVTTTDVVPVVQQTAVTAIRLDMADPAASHLIGDRVTFDTFSVVEAEPSVIPLVTCNDAG